ncbi:NAD(P)/FAD-dependent oxidoreductase [Halobacterium zhouii]|uniref:NAD(P)/FAD-dependent oxidoreductase n=1 Tax=Halobacterium zhouii TaxID=2902624 RepID=UPI001E31E23C|nr:FAD-dependent oxidoreductase [Halobacterium zhouii]
MRVVVLGAGYAGVVLVRRLERRLPDDVELIVVDDTGTHLVQHELHRVVRKPEFADDITIRIDDLFDRAKTYRSTVKSIDRDERVVHFEDGDDLAYDVAAVCLGTETADYDLPGVEEHGTPLKRLPHAATIRRDFLDVVDDGGGTVVVGGAGLSGVQTAGELAALARENGIESDVDVLLVEQRPDVASSFPQNFRTAVRDELDREGVWVHTDAEITRVTNSEIHLERRDPIAYDQFVWTGGIRGTDALEGERPDVRADLALDERTFALGDAARVLDAEGTMVPASAQTAIREAKVAARNIETVVADHRDSANGFRPRLDRYTFESPGWAVSIGDSAVAQVGSKVVRGSAANALKSAIGMRYLASAGGIRDVVRLLGDEFDVDVERRQ